MDDTLDRGVKIHYCTEKFHLILELITRIKREAQPSLL